MHVTLARVAVRPEHVDDFSAATRRNHAGSFAETDNLGFDMLQSAEDPSAW